MRYEFDFYDKSPNIFKNGRNDFLLIDWVKS